MKWQVAFSFIAVSAPFTAATTLYNGAQQIVLSSNMTSGCASAFDTPINCVANTIQLVTYSMQSTGWNTTSLTSLCTPACNASLSTLASAVSSGCGTESFNFNNGVMTYVEFLDYFQYKFGLICLRDSGSGDFCSDVEMSWNITSMITAGTVKWPTNTFKEYIDIDSGAWGPLLDVNDTFIYPYDDYFWINASDVTTDLTPVALDYFYDRPDPIDDDNYGWTLPLHYDEYPLEIQCSQCFLDKFVHGFSHRWGDVWDEIIEQVWANVKLNCGLTYTPIPANNLTGNSNRIDLQYLTNNNTSVYCPQTLHATEATQTCQSFCTHYQISTAALIALNGGVSCQSLSNASYCAPQSCPVAVVYQYTDYQPFVDQYSNMTYAQFLAWNPFVELTTLSPGEVVCVGPVGKAYVPSLGQAATPLVYTTTASAPLPTISDTILNCGLYYEVRTGEDCNTIALNFSLTLNQLVAMNPSINANCSNLYAGYDYCVAPVNGTAVLTAITTSVGTMTVSNAATPTASGGPVITPTPHQPNIVSNCRKFDIAVSGDTCEIMAARNGITVANLETWNPDVGSQCQNLWLGYHYCAGL